MTDHKINKIKVIGDIVQYKLKDNDKVVEFTGGAKATAHILKSVFTDTNIEYPADPQPSGIISRKIKDFTKSSEAPSEKVWRCVVEPPFEEFLPLNHLSQTGDRTTEQKDDSTTEQKFDLLVIENLGESFKNPEVKNILNNLETSLTKQDDACFPQIILMINISTPNLNSDNQAWKTLFDKYKEKVLVVIDADHLCSEGLNISRGISWERTAQDYLAELYTYQTLHKIGKFKHLVVRFGVGGVIYSFRIGDRQIHRLYFDPESYQMGLDSSDEGFMFGNNPILAISIIKEIAEKIEICNNDYDIIDKVIGVGISKGICTYQKNHENGFGAYTKGSVDSIKENFANEENFMNHFKVLFNNEQTNYWKRIANERIPVGNPAWSILNQTAEYNLLKVAEKIVTNGVDGALNNKSCKETDKKTDPIRWTPLVIFKSEEDKKMIVIDRREIEGYSIAHRLISQTMRLKEAKKPLSVAVFGPPGSGKSTVTKAIIGSVKEPKVDLKTFNLAKCTNYEEFKGELKDHFDTFFKSKRDKIPVVFFDEFDCKLGDYNLGWLKYFLPLMEDFKWNDYKGTKSDPPKTTPIFIFAGGTSHTYLGFAREDLSIGDEEQIKFAMAKGPDFVSRLRGHINILGPNRVDEYDDAYVVRRALVLDYLFRKIPKKQVSKRSRGDKEARSWTE